MNDYIYLLRVISRPFSTKTSIVNSTMMLVHIKFNLKKLFSMCSSIIDKDYYNKLILIKYSSILKLPN